MPKGVIGNQEQLIATGPTRLRDDLREIEIGVVNFSRGQGELLATLRLRDKIEDDLAELERAGIEVRAERTRLSTVDNMLMRNAGRATRDLQGLTPAAEARRQENPPDERWWWHLDAIWTGRMRRSVIKYGIIFVAVVLIVLGVDLILSRISGLSPAEKEAQRHTSAGEQYLYTGRIAEAIAEYEQAVALQPDLYDAYAALTALYTVEERQADAQAAAVQAEAMAPSRNAYLLAVARAYTAVNRLNEALAAADEAVALEPESPEAYLIRAGVFETQRDYDKATADLEKSAGLALAQGKNAIYVLAQTRLGMLLQAGPTGGFGQPGMGQ
jgi:tetratricopeptide (TPR) repeat protein